MKATLHPKRALGLLTIACLVAGCSEPVGRTKTTNKEVVDTPTEKTTTTTTREKDTRIEPR